MALKHLQPNEAIELALKRQGEERITVRLVAPIIPTETDIADAAIQLVIDPRREHWESLVSLVRQHLSTHEEEQ